MADKRFLYLAAVLAGTAIATKVGGLAFLAVAIPFAVVEARRHWKSAAVCAVALLLVAVDGAADLRHRLWQRPETPSSPS